MKASTLQLIKLINDGKTANEIATTLEISNKQLFNRLLQLKNIGLDYNRQYYSTGDIIYKKIREINPDTKATELIMKPDEQSLDAMVISDTHIGSVNEKIDWLVTIYEFCKKNNIHTILNVGDLIDGLCGSGTHIHQDYMEQMEYALRVYPFDRKILNYVVLGNHDIDSFKKEGIDLRLLLKNYRHDIIPLGYETGIINIQKDKIILKHPIHSESRKDKSCLGRDIIFKGHQHRMKIELSDSGGCLVYVPTLSNIIFSSNSIAGALRLKLTFHSGYIKEMNIKQLHINNHTLNCLNEFSIPFHRESEENNQVIEETSVKVKEK